MVRKESLRRGQPLALQETPRRKYFVGSGDQHTAGRVEGHSGDGSSERLNLHAGAMVREENSRRGI